MQTLFDLKIGQKCQICEILIYDSMRRRLIDLGITPKSTIKCVGKSMCGDPKSFLINGAVIALRKEISQKITITEAIK